LRDSGGKRRVRILDRCDFFCGCWLWRGYTYPSGYGYISFGGVRKTVHRWAYILWNGLVADGLDVHHICGHRSCCNPEHLLVLSRKAHAQLDRTGLRNGQNTHPERRAVGARNGAVLYPEKLVRGVDVHTAKLNPAKVRKIRAASGLQREVAERFGVDQTTVSRIKLNKSWAHV
jgi:hypothetical protein